MSELEQPSTSDTESRRDRLIMLGLILLTLACFWPLGRADFTNYDDPSYVTYNPVIRQGLNFETLKYSLVSFDSGYWHPLTWLSHALDVTLYGPRVGDPPPYFPAGHHFTNLLLHLADTLLLWLVLKRLTGVVWASAWVAAMFAIHPMHVESVAWIAERKSVLSTLFFLLTILAYHRYVERRSLGRYLLIVLAFAGALMSKPITVTTPCVLLLLDIWPLGRIQFGPRFWRSLVRPVVEKLPLLLLSVGSSALTIYSTIKVKTFYYVEDVSIKQRLETSIISYARYLGKLVWPTHLSIFYPFPSVWPVSWIAGSCVLFAVLTGLAISQGKKRPYILVGWLWFVGTLVPVIGLFAVGDSSLADRYSYLSYIGLFIAMAWLAMTLPPRFKDLVIGAAVLSILLCAGLSYRQVWNWQDTQALMGHAINVTRNNWLANVNYGYALLGTPHEREAEAYFKEALRIRPYGGVPNIAYAKFLLDQKRLEEAMPHILLAKEATPDAWKWKSLYGRALAMSGHHKEAIDLFEQILTSHPQAVDAEMYLARSLVAVGRVEEAEEHFHNALRYDPSLAKAHHELGLIAAATGRPGDAINEFEAAINVNPGLGIAYLDYGIALANVGKYQDALNELAQADHFLGEEELHERSTMEMTTGKLMEKLGHPMEGGEHFLKAIDLAKREVARSPNEPVAYYQLATTLKELAQPEEAAAAARKAVELSVARGNRYFLIEIRKQFPDLEFPTTTQPTSRPATLPSAG